MEVCRRLIKAGLDPANGWITTRPNGAQQTQTHMPSSGAAMFALRKAWEISDAIVFANAAAPEDGHTLMPSGRNAYWPTTLRFVGACGGCGGCGTEELC